MRWFHLPTILLWFLVLPVNAQDDAAAESPPVRKRVDLSADTFAGIDSAGTAVQRLVGNVRLSQEQTRLSADRATQYPDRDEILFVGNVVVYERGDTLSARRVLYNRSTKVGKAFGSVRLTDGDVVVTAPSAIYDTRVKRTDFTEGVTLVDSASVLVSDTGTYWSESKEAEFVGRVRLRTDDATVRADSLDYDRKTQVSRARGNVFVHSVELAAGSSATDTTSITAVVADRALNDRQRDTESLHGDVLLFQVRFDSSSVDTLLMRSEALRIVKSDSLDKMFSSGDVRIWNMATSAMADSVMYESSSIDGIRRETVHMFENPVAWYESSQIYGDTIRIASSEGEPDSMRVVGRTFLAESDDDSGRVHQVKGRDMVGRFLDAGRRRMVVEPNAEALYFLKDGDAPNGAVRTSADRIIFEFVDDEMKHVRAEGGVEGTYYPEGKLPESNLEGFRWMIDSRPDKMTLLADPRMLSDVQSPGETGLPSRPRPTVRQPRPEPPIIATTEPPEILPEGNVPVPVLDWRPGAIDKSRGGFTLVVASRPKEAEARQIAATMAGLVRPDGLKTDLFRGQVNGVTYYRVGVGRFATQSGAERVLRILRNRLPEGTWILRIADNM